MNKLGIPIDESTALPDMKKNIDNLENEMKKKDQVEIKTTNRFCNGIYAREVFIPKGVILTGKIHKQAHINIISKGKISVATEYGVEILKAPCTIISEPGTKRAGYAHEDTVWTTIHATEETDLEVIEDLFIAKDHDDFLEYKRNLLGK